MASWTEQELNELTSRVVDGAAEPMEVERLGEILESDASARRLYRRHMKLHALLVWQRGPRAELAYDDGEPAQGEPAQDNPAPAPVALDSWSQAAFRFVATPTGMSLLGATTIVAGFILTLAMIYRPVVDATVEQSAAAAPAPVVAQLAAAESCEWRIDGAAPAVGDALVQGRLLTLQSGEATIAFRDGAEVRLNGPASFRLDSSAGGFLQIGHLSTRVPRQAAGFTIRTDAARIVDIGTEFSVTVDAQRSSSISTYRGMVDVNVPDSRSPTLWRTRRLYAGERMKVDLVGGALAPSSEDAELSTEAPRIAVAGRLLLQDRFDVDADKMFAERTAPERRRGLVGVLSSSDSPYVVSGDVSLKARATRDRHGVLELRDGGRISPVLKLTREQIERAGGLAIELSMMFPRDADDPNDELSRIRHWLGLRTMIDPASRLDEWNSPAAKPGVHFHFRGSGQFSFYEDGQRWPKTKNTWPNYTALQKGWRQIRVELHVDRLDGSRPMRMVGYTQGVATPFMDLLSEGGFHSGCLTLEYVDHRKQADGLLLIDWLRISLLQREAEKRQDELQ